MHHGDATTKNKPLTHGPPGVNVHVLKSSHFKNGQEKIRPAVGESLEGVVVTDRRHPHLGCAIVLGFHYSGGHKILHKWWNYIHLTNKMKTSNWEQSKKSIKQQQRQQSLVVIAYCLFEKNVQGISWNYSRNYKFT